MMCFHPHPFFSHHNLLGTCDFTWYVNIYFICAWISCIFFNNGGVHCYLGVSSYHERISRKVFITVAGGMIMTNHVKWNGKFYWKEFFIVELWTPLVCDGPVSSLLYCPFELYPFILCQIIPQVNAMLQHREYLILKFFLIYFKSIYWIIGPILLSNTLSTWFPMLDLPPGRYNIPRHVVMYFSTTTIAIVARLTWKFSWYHDTFLNVLFCMIS